MTDAPTLDLRRDLHHAGEAASACERQAETSENGGSYKWAGVCRDRASAIRRLMSRVDPKLDTPQPAEAAE